MTAMTDDVSDAVLAELEWLTKRWRDGVRLYASALASSGADNPAVRRAGERCDADYSNMTGTLSRHADRLLAEIRRRRAGETNG
jgi:hypothetical protein